MPSRETGKQRAARIPLDYFKHTDRFDRWKVWLGAIAGLAALAWFAAGFLSPVQGQLKYSRGPVAAVHATWENQCDACHVPFQPIQGSTWTTTFIRNDAHATDARCQKCHTGPEHHATQSKEMTPSCAACHRDHRGRDASLVQMPDSDCTRCHADLAASMTGTPGFADHIHRFDTDHPEFRIVRTKAKDPGTLKFNHALHLTAGMRRVQDGKPFRLAQIPEGERSRYRLEGQNEQDAVQLNCASCHQLENGGQTQPADRVAAQIAPPRGAGTYMLPVTYDNHCRSCHPLTFDPKMPDRSMPHHLQPDQVRQYLWDAYAAQALSNRPDLMNKAVPSQPRPDQPVDENVATVRTEVQDKVSRAETYLFTGNAACGECHHMEYGSDGVTPKRIAPTQVNALWFQNAVFSHVAHRAVKCESCHAQANTSAVSSDVLIPGRDTCLQCHAPQSRSAAVVKGGARFDCVECHQYHQGTNQSAVRQGIGNPERGVSERMDVLQFLSGGGASGR